MAFKKIDKLIVTRKVDIYVPRDGEGADKVEMDVKLEILRNDDEQKLTYDKPFFMRVVKGWGRYQQPVRDAAGQVVKDDAGNDKWEDVPFNETELADFLAQDYVIASLQNVYIACTLGAARGNF